MRRKSKIKIEGWIVQYRSLSPAIYGDEDYLHYRVGINEHEIRAEYDKRPGWRLRKVTLIFEDGEI